MDDKYKKQYEKQKRQSQFHENLTNKWVEPKNPKVKWEHERAKLKHPKPDPATVEAELRLEEELWAS